MKSICLFSSYYTGASIPYYIKYYLNDLKKYFTEIVFITNDKTLSEEDLSYLKDRNFSLMLVANEGFDFGMWYKAMKEFDPLKYDRVGLINDSCILFKPLETSFEKINKSDWDYCGMISSRRMNYHIQSFFVIINKNAIQPVFDYFQKHGVISDYKEVIRVYEVGLSEHLKRINLKLGALYFSKENIEEHNPSFLLIDELIKEGVPLIKKKIIFRSYRRGEYLTLLRMNFNVDQDYYINLIHIANPTESLIDFKLVFKDFKRKNNLDITIYKASRWLYNISKKSKILSHIFHRLILIRRKIRGDVNREIITRSRPEREV